MILVRRRYWSNGLDLGVTNGKPSKKHSNPEEKASNEEPYDHVLAI